MDKNMYQRKAPIRNHPDRLATTRERVIPKVLGVSDTASPKLQLFSNELPEGSTPSPNPKRTPAQVRTQNYRDPDLQFSTPS